MKDRLLFLRAFARTLCICLAVWAAAMAALVWLNWRWSAEDILTNEYEARRSAGSLLGDEAGFSGRLSVIADSELERYGGQMLLRIYDEEGGVLGQSQLLMAWIAKDGFLQYALFDAVMTDAEQLAAARVLMEYPWLRASQPYDEASAAFESLELTGWAEGEAFFPIRAVLHLAGEEITLVDADPARFPGKTMEHIQIHYADFYSALAGRGGPKMRLEQYRTLEAEMDAWIEQLLTQDPRTGLTYDQMIMTAGGTAPRTFPNMSMDGSLEQIVVSNYALPPFYLLYGLEPAILLTLAAAVALACWLTWLETRAIRRERNFTRAAAHELKTPLAVLRSHAEALREDIDPAKRTQYLDVVLDESDRMAALVGQLLDLSRLERGVPLKRERVDFAALVRACFDRLSLSAGERDLHVTLNLTEGMVSGDRARLEEAVGNLASNALRYTPAGGSISVRLENSRGKLWLAVDNDGRGFTPRELSRLWEPFYRGDPARSRDTGGAGLGLAIVRAAVRAHGGTCGAENRAGGVRFWLELPALQSDG